MAKINFIKIPTKVLSQLQAITTNPESPSRLILRAKVILMWHQGKNIKETQQQLKVTDVFIRKWRDRFAEHGVEGLKAQSNGGGRPIGFRPGNPTNVILTPAVLIKLQSIAANPKADPRYLKKVKVILYWYEGKSYKDTRDDLTSNDQYILKWRKRFLEKGIDGLKDLPKAGGPRLDPPARKIQIPIEIPPARMRQLRGVAGDKTVSSDEVKKAKAVLMWLDKKTIRQSAKMLQTASSNVVKWRIEFKEKYNNPYSA